MPRRSYVAAALIALAASSAAADEKTPASAAQSEVAAAAWWEQDIWRDPERGFHWYPPPPRAKPRTDKRSEQTTHTPQSPPRLEDIRDIEALRAEVKRRLEVAVMDPTQDNVRDYLEANTFLMRKSALFADQWRRVVWANPEFDYNTVNPAANFAQVELKTARRYEEERTLRELARDYGLIVFVRSDCPFCRLQAPVLRGLSARVGLEVLPVSLDGVPTAEYPDARPDGGMSRVLTGGAGVRAVPSLYLVSRRDRSTVFLGAGVMSADEIAMRAHVLTRVGLGADMGAAVR